MRDFVWRGGGAHLEEKTVTLLKWALLFFVISIVAGILGFTGVSAASADIARVLFYIFVVIFLALLLLGLTIFRLFRAVPSGLTRDATPASEAVSAKLFHSSPMERR